VFGTYHHPEKNAFPEHTGVTGEGAGNTLYEAIVYPFVEWGRSSYRALRLAFARMHRI
jgi:hypothetical protein